MDRGRIIVIGSSLIILLLLENIFYAYRHTHHVTTPMTVPTPQNCSNGRSAHAGIGASNEPSLAKLAEYESVCHGSVVDHLMLFTAMPTSSDEASQFAQRAAGQLQAFATANISPLVVFEPSLDHPADLQAIHNDTYNPILQTYFDSLKSAHVTDQQMGTWVLFPEANTPLWSTTSPELFVQNVTKVARMQKGVFPASKATIMLNSRTYPDNDASWDHGELKDLSPYLATLPRGLIDSFGYQGFPFVSQSNASNHTEQLNAPDFLPHAIAVAAAEQLGVHDIWFNTGTFGRKYTNDPAAEVTLTPKQRQATLQSILTEAKAVKNAQFSVSVNLFAADKSADAEHTDWSYWQPGRTTSSDSTSVFDTFVRELRQEQIGFSLYDYKP